MRRTLALVAALALAGSGTAWAQASLKQIESRHTPAYGRCMASGSALSTAGMLDCIGAETQIQDRRLNTAYAKAMKDLTPEQRERLRAAQRAWLTFREADCAAVVDPEQWGSLSRINGATCELNRTIERTIELEAFPPET